MKMIYFKPVFYILLLTIGLSLYGKTGNKTKNKLKRNKSQYEKYWDKLKVKANKIYKGFDTDLELGIGSYVDEDNGENVRGEIKLSIPLFSKEERRKKAEEKEKFLKEGAGHIEQLRKVDVSLSILRKKSKFLKSLLLQEGVKSVEAFYTNEERIEYKKAEKETAKRKLEAMLM